MSSFFITLLSDFTSLGQVVVHSLSTPESYSFDMKRPMRTVAMEPNFAKRGTRAFVCGGLSGALVMREKGWLGHKETTLHVGEGPIWQVRWRGRLIAWANDLVIYLFCFFFIKSDFLLSGRVSRSTTLSLKHGLPTSTDLPIHPALTSSNVLSIGKMTRLCSSLGLMLSKLPVSAPDHVKTTMHQPPISLLS